MPFIALDLETTGLNLISDRVIEVAAIRFDPTGQVLDQFESLIRPDCPISESARSVHGLSEIDLHSAPSPNEVWPAFVRFLHSSPSPITIAHNACIDAGFLGSELRRVGLSLPELFIIDTLSLSRQRFPTLGSHRLERMVTLLELGRGVSHRALADAQRVKELWLRLHNETPLESIWQYPIHDPVHGCPAPAGWTRLEAAIDRGQAVRILHEGTRRRRGPRWITPLRFIQKGGDPYVVAVCHVSRREKAFRLDRIRDYEIGQEVEATDHRVDRGPRSR